MPIPGPNPDPKPRPQAFAYRARALRTASSAAIWAAKGVDLREPLNPMVPAEDHEIVLPCASVMVIMVLLNVEFTWATPDTMFFVRDGGRGSHLLPLGLSFNRASKRARPNPGLVETVRRSLLLAGDGLRLALAGAGVGVGALAAHRQLLSMAQAAIGARSISRLMLIETSRRRSPRPCSRGRSFRESAELPRP